MDTKVAIVDDANKRQRVERMYQEVVKRLVVFLTGFVVKIHGLGHLHGLVVSSEH